MKLTHFAFRVFTPVMLLALPLTLSAQPAANTPHAQGQRQILQGGGAAGFGLGGPVGVLTDEQRASYQAAMTRQRAQILELQAQLRVARQEFVAASVDQKFDENALRQKATAAFRPEIEMAVLRAKALSEVQPPLTAEQIEKIKTGQPGPARPLRQRQQLETPAPHNPAVNTNTDANGLPPKK